MIKKVLFLFLVILMISGCTSNLRQEEITFSSWGSVTEVKILKDAIKAFEYENPNIKIKFMHIPQNYFQKIHLLFASNTAPDVLFMNNLNLPIYESKLENLDDFINIEEFYPQAIAGMSYDENLKGIPRDISNLVLYINLDKVNLPDSNWNLEDLLLLALKSTDNKMFGIGAENEIYWTLPYLSYFGGGVLDNEHKLIIESKESKQGLDFYKDLVYRYKVSPNKSQIGSSTLAQMFLDEQIAIYLSGRWMYPKISEKASFDWAVINFPYGKSPQFCDVSGWVISKDSKHKDSAKKFIQFLASEETSEYFTRTGLVVPARISVSKLLNNDKHNEKIFINVIRKSTNTPVNKTYRKLIDKINLEEFN